MRPLEYLRRREESLRGSLHAGGSRLVSDVDRRLDLSDRIRAHPWLGLGGGALAGCVVGVLVAPVSVGRLARGTLRRSIGLATALALRGSLHATDPEAGAPDASSPGGGAGEEG